MRGRLRKNWLLLLAGALALLCLFSVWRIHAVSNLLLSQQAAQRWQGQSGKSFAQVSCFTSKGEEMDLDQVLSFRSAMAQKLKEASFDLEKEQGLYIDAWSVSCSVHVSSGRRSGEVQAVAVSGRFFDFHPVRLISGNYLSPNDLMEDRVLLDRETAWLLFGGSDLTGMGFDLNGVPVVVAGVYEHESDAFSKKASEGAMRIYMRYELYERLFPEKKGISCYEFVMADPVKGFARSAAEEKYPLKSAEILENSARFEIPRLWKLLRSRMERTMRKTTAVYPDWENAARAAEDRAALWLGSAIACAVLPVVLLVVYIVRYARIGKRKLEEDLLPEAKDRVEEAVRVRARRRWEKQHPDMK